MFSKLKNKLKNWTKALVKKAEPEEIEEIVIEETEKKEKAEKEKRKEEKQKKKQEKKEERKAKKEKKKETKEIPVPEKFNVGIQKFEPDLEKLQEIKESLEDEGIEESELTKPLEGAAVGDVAAEEKPKEKKSFFQKLTSKISKVKFSERNFEIYAEELEMLLLENNVAVEVAEKIIKELKEKIVGKEFLKKEIEAQIQFAFEDIIRDILIEPFDLIEKIKLKKADGKPYVILFCGINGTGKTTTIAKIAEMLKRKKLSCVFAAGDTFRAASIEQLNKHGERLKVKVISQKYGADPAAVGFDAVKYAEKNRIDAVLIDTAGRMYTEKNLMEQISKIARVCKPDAKIFVGESITGNDAIEQAKAFNDAVGIDGIILSKADIDEKGGTALSVGYVTKKPILFLGTGQEYNAIEVFDKNKFIEKLGLKE